jgi:4-hydroxy-2-oxoheptanedioate aldolase
MERGAVMDKSADGLAFWLTTANVGMVEIAHGIGFRECVVDAEHGVFDPSSLDKLVVLCKALGVRMLIKVSGPEMIPIQQALDVGADGVVIPHIRGADHARSVTATAKFPPLGSRSFAGGRTTGYGVPGEDYFDHENRSTMCFPMIESAEALNDIAQILALPTVDGVFVGPSDLALSRGRPSYNFTQEDQDDLRAIAEAAAAARKPWIMPAWTSGERVLSRQLNAASMVVVHEFAALGAGMRAILTEMAGD